MHAAIYVRVSTDQQAEKGYSIDTQLEACRKYAVELGVDTIEEFVDDGYSGEFIDRPALTELRKKLRDKVFDFVIAYAPDRLARKTIHLLILSEEIGKAGAVRKFASVNFEKTPEGELMYKFQGIVAEYEKEKIKERTMRGKRGKALKGLVISDAKPFGYIFDAQKSTYTIHEAEAEIVRMIFDFIVKEQMGTARICKELNARGIPTPRSKKSWVTSSVHRILTNTIYKGIIQSMKFQYEKVGLNKKKRTRRPESEWIAIRVPAIIDEITWQAAQKQLQENKDHSIRNLKRDYLLNGYVICAKCGRAMVISYSGCQKAISYYACLTRKGLSSAHTGRECCTARQVPAMLLDEYVFSYLLKLCYDPDKIADYIQAASLKKEDRKHKIALDQIVKTEKELLNQKDIVMRWFRQRMLTESEAETQLKDLHQQLTDIEQIKKSYEAKMAAASPTRSAAEITASIKGKLHQDSFTAQEKRAALQTILASVIVERVDDTRGRGSKPEIHVQIQLK